MANKVEIIVEATDRASSILGGLGKTLGGIGAIAAGALAGGLLLAGKAMSDFASAAMEAEEVQARFNTLVDNSNLAGFKGEMEELAQSLSTLTRFEDENILEAEAMLATYQTIGADIFPMVLQSTLDLAEYMKTDAVGAAEALGRAMSDIEGGSLSLLTRQKLLTKEQADMAKKIAETTGVADAQAYIIEILDGKIGGLAETMGNTTAGQFQIFQNTLGNIKEQLGAAIIPAFLELARVLNEKLADPKVQEFISEFAKTLADIALYGVEGIQTLSDALEDVFGFIEKIGDGMSLRTALITSFDYETIKPFVNVLDGLKPIFDSLGGVFEELGGKVKAFVDESLKKITDWYQENKPLIEEFATLMVDLWTNNIAPALVMAWEIIEPILSGLLDIILQIGTLIMQVATGDWAGAWESIQMILQTAVTAIWAAIVGLFETIATLFGGSLEEIRIIWTDNWNQFVQIVTTIWQIILAKITETLTLIRDGIVAKFNEIKALVATAVTALVSNVIMKFLQLKSDIKQKWDGIKQDISSAVGEIYSTVIRGFQTMYNNVEAKMREIAKMLFDRAQGWLQQIVRGTQGMAAGVIAQLNAIIAEIQAGLVDIIIDVIFRVGPMPRIPGVPPPVGGGGGCFVAGTPVTMADGSKRPIEAVKIGDKVVSRFGKMNITAEVEETFAHAPEEIEGYYIINHLIGVTGNHLILVNGEWRSADSLQVGDMLTGIMWPVVVRSIEYIEKPVAVYNLHTSHESHNYFVHDVCVHNVKREHDYATGTGGWLQVPNGYPNDSFRMGLTSGEQYAVIPEGGSLPTNVTVNVGSVRDEEDIREIARQVARIFA